MKKVFYVLGFLVLLFALIKVFKKKEPVDDTTVKPATSFEELEQLPIHSDIKLPVDGGYTGGIGNMDLGLIRVPLDAIRPLVKGSEGWIEHNFGNPEDYAGQFEEYYQSKRVPVLEY